MPDANQERLQTNYRQYNPGQLKSQEIKPQVSSHFNSEMSFVSLALGILGLILPLFSTLSIITGIAGLMQINRTNIKGKWMAVTGIVFGVMGILMFLLAIFFGINFIQGMIPAGFDQQLLGMVK